MRPIWTVALFLITSLVLAGCGEPRPTYDEVRAEANAVLAQVDALIPGHTTARPRSEQAPYGCGSDSLPGAGDGTAFYTGYWEVEVDDEVDIPAFIAELPERLGKGWAKEDLGIEVPFAQVHLLHDSPRLSLTVEQRDRHGKQGIDLLVMSRCGVLDSPHEEQ